MKRFTVLIFACVLSAPQLYFSCALFSETLKQTVPKERISADEAVESYYEGDVEKSVASLEAIIARDPKSKPARKRLAYLLREIGDYGKAIPQFEELYRLLPGDRQAESELFTTLCLAGDYGKARTRLPLSVETPETVLYEAYLALRLEDYSEAEKQLRIALIMQDNRPLAWYALGRVLAERNPAEAETCFKTALRQDPSLTFALPFLADTLLAQNKTKEAYPLLLRIRTVLPGRPDIAEKIAQIERGLPELPKKRDEAVQTKKKRAEPPAVPPLAFGSRGDGAVRVGLADDLFSLALKTGDAYSISAICQTLAVHGKAGELLTVKGSPEGIRVLDEAGDTIFACSSSVELRYEAPTATTLVFDVLSEEGSFYAITEDRAYRGILEFRPGEKSFTLINVLGIEEYLAGVLPSEMPPTWPEEALRAQAIAARSYTLASLGGYSSRGYDVHGSVLSAAYRGVTGETPATTDAVLATRGRILEAKGKPLRAYFSANHGGYSENSLSVWGTEDSMQAVPDGLVKPRETPLPLDDLDAWLKDDPEAYSAQESYYQTSAYRWEKWVSAEEIALRLKRDKDIGKVLKIIPRGRGISGRVQEAEIIGTAGSVRVKGDRVRARLGGLRSTLFTIRPLLGLDGKPEYFIFSGGGWGHGVGLDQSGAAGMAAAGYSAEKILKWYYPRAEIADYGM